MKHVSGVVLWCSEHVRTGDGGKVLLSPGPFADCFSVIPLALGEQRRVSFWRRAAHWGGECVRSSKDRVWASVGVGTSGGRQGARSLVTLKRRAVIATLHRGIN